MLGKLPLDAKRAAQNKMEEAPPCLHYWDIDTSLKGICKYCEEERQFPWDARKKSIVLKEGRKEGRKMALILSEYTPEEKARIVKESDEEGVEAVCKKYDIPKSTLYTWRTRRQRKKLKVEAAVSKPADELVVLPQDLLLRRDGDVVQLYCQGKRWAVFSATDVFQRELTQRTIMELVERYLRDGTLAKGEGGEL